MTTAAISTEYISEAELKATLELSNTSFADADIPRAISAASRGIDEACQRRFYKDTADVIRYYTPLTTEQVVIDDLAEVTSVLADQEGDGTFTETWVLNTDYTLGPLNAAADGEPYTRILRHPLSMFALPYWYPRSVQVTGKFGWPSVPAQIQQATTILATQLFKRAREAPFGIVTFGMDVGSTARLAVSDPSVRFLIDPYKRERPQ